MNEPDAGRVTHRDKDGRPLELLEWARLHEDLAYRLVAETQVGDALVRTQWEGIDDGVQVACMWHTGVRRDGRWTTIWEGYWPCTLDEAVAEHEQVAADVLDLKFAMVLLPPADN
ncbi:hypothetical protein [Streptomyces sp. NPDC088360]|uniref:hypothetical protein n=1 Tax=Streptomyces sp. NPDC088360 TaxID=3154515 RepID=UPI00344DA052